MRHMIFDTETTSLIQNSLQPLKKQPRIVEFFGLVLKDKIEGGFEEVETIYSRFDPEGTPMHPEATKATGITSEMLIGEPLFAKFTTLLKRTIESCDVVVAHNLSFDMAIVDFEMKRANQTVGWPAGRICTVEATESMKGYRLNLGTLHTELFGAGFEKAHSAEHDVRATARCYQELIKKGEV